MLKIKPTHAGFIALQKTLLLHM